MVIEIMRKNVVDRDNVDKCGNGDNVEKCGRSR